MADAKITALNSLTKSTVAITDVLPIVDISANETKKIQLDELLQPQDSTFRVVGSADQTKKVAFEVDGLTTATTRTLTVSDEDGTIVTNNNTVTVNNKTLGTNTKVAVGSDATGDIHYRDASGSLTRLPIGSTNYILQSSSGGLPEWVSNPAATNGSTTANGTFEEATAAEINAGTATGATGARLAVTAAGLASSAPTFSAANLTNIPQGKLSLTTTDVTFASSTAENTLLSYSVPGGTLSTSNIVRVTLHVSALAVTNTNTVTFRFKYGATTHTSATFTATGAIAWTGKIEFLVAGAGTTSSQNGSIAVNLGTSGYVGNGNLQPQYFAHSSQGTSAIDSTSAQTLAVTSQHSNNNASDNITVSMIVVEKIA